ncbi:MAG: cupredoxin domain-containing protein [Marmoricola sp.]
MTSSDHACTLSATTAPAGSLVFSIKNQGKKVTEFYVYAEDGVRVVGEVENIGPGLSGEVVVHAPAGTYHTACKPGMLGKGIRATFTVEK